MAKTMNKVKTGANALTFVALTLLGLVAVNIVANRFFLRTDFTQDKIYTLSPSSKELVAKLPDRMTVKAFISKDLQPPFSQVAQYVRDLLSEYAQASKGKLNWEVIDPGTDAKLEEEATKLKVPKMRRGRVSSDKVEIGSNYLGIAFEYQGNIESIPQIDSPEGLEYQISGLVKMMTVKKKKVAFASSEGELALQGDQQTAHGLQIMGEFMKEYEVVPVTLNQGEKPIPDDVDALVVAGPRQPVSDRAKYVIDQFLMRGKSVALLVDGMVIESPRGMNMPNMEGPKIGRKNEVGLEDFLEHYGFKVKDDVVMEPRLNVPGPVPVGGQMFLANYPTFLAATKLAEKISVTDHIKAIIFPFASSLERVKDKQPGVQVTELAWSSAESWRQSGFFMFDPQNTKLKVGDDKGPFLLAASAQGKFKSFYAGKPHPNEKGEPVAAPPVDSSMAPGVERPVDESPASARLVVIADSEFASDEYLRLTRNIPTYGSNLLFALNLVDYLAQDETLAPIRAKGVQSRPLTYSREGTPALVKFANIVGAPLAFIIFGIARWRLRLAGRKNVKL